MLAFATYFEANLVISFCLLCFLAVHIISRNTMLFVALLGLLLVPHVFPVPTEYRGWFKDKMAFEVEKEKSGKLVEEAQSKENRSTDRDPDGEVFYQRLSEVFGVSEERVRSIHGETLEGVEISLDQMMGGSSKERMEAVLNLYESMGATLGVDEKRMELIQDLVASKAGNNSWFDRSLTQGGEVENGRTPQKGGLPSVIESIKKGETQTITIDKDFRKSFLGGGESKEIKVTRLLKDAFQDPEAMWLVIRFFWIVGGFYIFMQKQSWGIGLLSMNLMPFAYLTEFIPFVMYIAEENPSTRVANYLFDNPQQLIAAVMRMDVNPWSLPMLGLALVFAFYMLWRLIIKSQRSKMADYLDPNHFQIMMYGELRDFQISEEQIWVDGVPIEINKMRYDPKNKKKWFLASGSEIEFIERDSG
ncbi:MAG: hypothetical protein AAGA18_01340 [Verrucomicrobiota bacterium]